MLYLSIVQSNVFCLLRLSCNADTDLVLAQNWERRNNITTREIVEINSPETRMHGIWRDWCLDGKFPSSYI